jgi:hypothetical protein
MSTTQITSAAFSITSFSMVRKSFIDLFSSSSLSEEIRASADGLITGFCCGEIRGAERVYLAVLIAATSDATIGAATTITSVVVDKLSCTKNKMRNNKMAAVIAPTSAALIA